MNKGLDTVLKVDNIRLKAHHGWYEEERIIGGMYSLNVSMFDQVQEDEDYSDLHASLNYELIYNKVVEIMKHEYHLIEESCKAVFDGVKKLKPTAIWEVHIVKENPPLKFVGSTQFTIKG